VSEVKVVMFYIDIRMNKDISTYILKTSEAYPFHEQIWLKIKSVQIHNTIALHTAVACNVLPFYQINNATVCIMKRLVTTERQQ